MKTRGLGTYAKYLAKAAAIASRGGEALTWDNYARVVHGYLALGAMETEY